MVSTDNAAPKTAEELGIGQSAHLPSEQRADNKNRTLAPFNRWSFQRVQQFTRTTRVPSAGNPSSLQERFQDLSQVTFQDHTGAPCTVADMLVRTYIDGFLVLHQGNGLSEQYFNGMDRSTLHLIMSCSKSITSAVAAARYANNTAPGGAYHNFWWINKPPTGAIVALGVSGQIIYVDIEKNFVASKFSSQPDYENAEMEADELRGLEAIAASIGR